MAVIQGAVADIPGILTGATFELARAPQLRCSWLGSALPGSGIPAALPQGAIVEIAGAGKTTAAIRFLAENPTLPVAWLEEEPSIYPPALTHDMEVERVLFIETSHGAPLSALSQVLRSQYFGAVVFVPRDPARLFAETLALRRLQIAVEKSGSILILLHNQPLPANPWPVAVRIDCGHITKYRGYL